MTEIVNTEEKLLLDIKCLNEELVHKIEKLRLVRTRNYQEHTNEENNGALTNEEIARYSRQIIVPGIGIRGQENLKRSSVLIVGAGGLGCPSSLYLVGAGVGNIGLVDYDDVELNNLHRQLLHNEISIGHHKVDSAKNSLHRINSNVTVTPYHTELSSKNAMDIIKPYDVVLDASDNVATRYLLNDACILSNKPLVSGSALQFEGQLTVYNYNDGPCYRCLFPIPPPPETVTNCGDGGVLGAVPGTIGTLQALEAIKILLNLPGVLAGRMLIFDGSDCTFRNISLRKRNINCSVCGENPQITSLIDYEKFCGSKANDKDPNLKLLQENERITATDYNIVCNKKVNHVLIDVRSTMEFEICHLPNAINIPFKDLKDEYVAEKIKSAISLEIKDNNSLFPVFVVCRRGNDSQKAVQLFKSSLEDTRITIQDIIGGLHSWSKTVDSSFPFY